MVLKRIPLALVLIITASVSVSGQEYHPSGQGPLRRDQFRTVPVAASVDDQLMTIQDPPPAPTNIMAPPLPVVDEQIMDAAAVPHADSSPMGIACYKCGAYCEAWPVSTCQECLQGTCQACGDTCYHYCHRCPPARWNVLGRLHYGYHTRVKPCLQASHWGYPEEFCERPFGAYVRANLCAQIRNGLQDQLILHRYDFVDPSLPDAYQLKPRGRYELAKIVASLQQHPMLQNGFQTIAVEETVDQPQLNEARRQYVLQQLELMQFPLGSEQVVIARAPTLGMSGEEALPVYNNLQLLWQMGGRGTGMGGQGRGSSSGSPGLGTGLGTGGMGLGTGGR